MSCEDERCGGGRGSVRAAGGGTGSRCLVDGEPSKRLARIGAQVVRDDVLGLDAVLHEVRVAHRLEGDVVDDAQVCEGESKEREQSAGTGTGRPGADGTVQSGAMGVAHSEHRG